MLNFCDFIQVYVFTTNHHLKKKLRIYLAICYHYIKLCFTYNFALSFLFRFPFHLPCVCVCVCVCVLLFFWFYFFIVFGKTFLNNMFLT